MSSLDKFNRAAEDLQRSHKEWMEIAEEVTASPIKSRDTLIKISELSDFADRIISDTWGLVENIDAELEAGNYSIDDESYKQLAALRKAALKEKDEMTIIRDELYNTSDSLIEGMMSTYKRENPSASKAEIYNTTFYICLSMMQDPQINTIVTKPLFDRALSLSKYDFGEGGDMSQWEAFRDDSIPAENIRRDKEWIRSHPMVGHRYMNLHLSFFLGRPQAQLSKEGYAVPIFLETVEKYDLLSVVDAKLRHSLEEDIDRLRKEYRINITEDYDYSSYDELVEKYPEHKV